MIRIESDPDAGIDVQAVLFQRERRQQGSEDLLRRSFGARLIGVEQDAGELIAAEPGHRIARAHDALQSRFHLLQQQVAVGMAEGVVDLLEAVQIHQQKGDLGAVTIRLPDRLTEAFAQQRAVRQTGQSVVVRLILQELFGTLAFGDVGMGADHPVRPAVRIAQRHGARQDPAGGAVFAHHAELALKVSRRLPPGTPRYSPGSAPYRPDAAAGPLLEQVLHLVVFQAQHIFETGRKIELIGRHVPVPDTVPRTQDRQFKPFPAHAQLFHAALKFEVGCRQLAAAAAKAVRARLPGRSRPAPPPPAWC